MVPTGDSIDAGYQTALDFFSQHEGPRPTWVTCYNDLVALGLLKALRELGLRVPEDVSVVGFDDLEVLNCFPQQLTTVHVPKSEMGEQAAQLLIQQIESNDGGVQKRVCLEAELVVRDSTAPRRKVVEEAQEAA